MKLVALLSWYDEPVGWLTELVASLAAASVDELVALDGAYALYPYGRARSSTDQAHALIGACAGAGVGLTLRQPRELWAGNEMEKRSALFALGHEVAEPGEDWLWVMDGDELVTQAPRLRENLAATRRDACEALAWFEQPATGELSYKWVRKLFRAQPDGITVERNHWSYRAGDGRYLWGDGAVRCERLWTLEIEHRLYKRPDVRRERQYEYYAERSAAGIETAPGVHCRAPTAAPGDNNVVGERGERAERSESTERWERAVGMESTDHAERAVDVEGTEGIARAVGVEGTEVRSDFVTVVEQREIHADV